MNIHVIKRFFIGITLIFFFIPDCQAQYLGTNKLDSLFRISRNHLIRDSVKVDLLNAISWQYYATGYRDSAHYYAESALALAQEMGYKRGLVATCGFLGNYYSDNNDTALAYAYYRKGLKAAQDVGDPKAIVHSLVNIGSFFKKDYSKSIAYYQQALEIAKQMGSAGDQASLYIEMAQLSQNFANYPKALEELYSALHVSHKLRDSLAEANSLFELGWFYNNIGNPGKAISYLKKSLFLSERLGQKKEAAKALGMLGNLYMNNRQYTLSLKYYTDCIEILKGLNEKLGLASAYANIAVLYQMMSDYTTALKYHNLSFGIAKKQRYKNPLLLYYKDMGNLIQAASDSLLLSIGIEPSQRYKVAIDYEDRALKIAKEENNTSQQPDILQFLISAYEKQGDYQAAYLNLKNLGTLKEGISGREKQKGIVRKEVEFNFKQKAAATQAAYEKAALKQQIIRNFLIGGLVVLLIFSFILIRQRNKTRRARKQAEQSERQKQRFFTNISHEFRTPLTLLMGPLEDLMHGGSVENFKAIVPEMYRNSRRLLRLINQLLDISRLDAEKYHLNPSRTDILPFTQQIVHSFSSLARAKDIALEMTVDSGLADRMAKAKTHFYFDEDVIEKIITNLLSNAFKYTSKEGRIDVSLSIAEDHFDWLQLKVQDSGTGISKEMIPHIFDRFYQVENQHSRATGSGIGLALVKELVEVHGGKISVQSNEGAGTTFYCLFPLNRKGAVTRPQRSHKMRGQVPVTDEEVDILDTAGSVSGVDGEGKPVILVVEDQQDVRKYICSHLKKQYEVIEAQNGKQGLQIALDHLPGLIISDVMMPEMDGFALCHALKTDQKTSHIPVILLTARAEDSDKMAGLETGADVYLIKPFNSKELVVRARNLITSRNQMRAKFSSNLFVKPAEVTVTSLDRELIDKLLKAVDAHLDDTKFSVDDLSEEVNMSTRQLNRKLKAIINQSPLQFIRSVRLQRAMEMLKNNSGNISEIAFKTGFETPSYFTKRFKEQFGCLPSEKEKFPEGG